MLITDIEIGKLYVEVNNGKVEVVNLKADDVFLKCYNGSDSATNVEVTHVCTLDTLNGMSILEGGIPKDACLEVVCENGISDLEMRDILNADALDLVEETVKAGASAAGAKKWWLGELAREANTRGVTLEELPITPQDVAQVEKLIADGKLNDKLAKQTVACVLAGEGTPDEVVNKHGFKVMNDDSALEAAVDAALAADPEVAEKLKSGNMKPMGAIIGAVMRATKGQADAKAVTKIVMAKIKG